MKKVLAFLMALMLLCSIGATVASAAQSDVKSDVGSKGAPSISVEGDLNFNVDVADTVKINLPIVNIFRPSVASQDIPVIIPILTVEGYFDAAIIDGDGNVIMGINVKGALHPNGELTITSVASGKNAHLNDCFNKILNAADASSIIPGLKNGYVIRDFFDVSLTGKAAQELAKNNRFLKINFKLGVDAAETVLGYCENAAKGVFEKINSVKNNGDGSVTTTFSHLCPVAFLVKSSSSGTGDGTGNGTGTGTVTSPETADFSANVLWALAAICGVAAVVTLTVSRKRSKAN